MKRAAYACQFYRHAKAPFRNDCIIICLLTLCMLGNFSRFCCPMLTFFKINFFTILFHEHNHESNCLDTGQVSTFCRSWSGSKLFAIVIGRRQEMPLASKELKYCKNWIGPLNLMNNLKRPILTFTRPLVKRAYQKKKKILFLNQNICCEYSKEPSQWDDSFEHPKNMLKLMGKRIFTIICSKLLLSKSMLLLQ